MHVPRTGPPPPVQVIAPLILSCLVGVCMSHAAYMLRDAVSATLFTIVGILCKVCELLVWNPGLHRCLVVLCPLPAPPTATLGDASMLLLCKVCELVWNPGLHRRLVVLCPLLAPQHAANSGDTIMCLLCVTPHRLIFIRC